MGDRLRLKTLVVEELKPRVYLTPIIERSGEECRIQQIKADSLATNGCGTFVPLRHVSKQKRKVIELEDENAKLRALCADMAAHLREAERLHNDILMPDDYERRMRELGMKVGA